VEKAAVTAGPGPMRYVSLAYAIWLTAECAAATRGRVVEAPVPMYGRCLERGAASFPWRTPQADVMVTVPDSFAGAEAYCGMSGVQEVRKWNEGGVPGCHSGEEIGPLDDTEGVRSVVGEHNCVGWGGTEGRDDSLADAIGPALDADSELQLGELWPCVVMHAMAAKRRHALQMVMGRMPRQLGRSKATHFLFKRASTPWIAKDSMAVTKARQVRRPAGQPKSRLEECHTCRRNGQELPPFAGCKQPELESPCRT
jgi:hypothetical protein